MRIGIDMLGCQSAGRSRGVGRYTRRLVQELLVRQPRTEFFLYFYAGCPGEDNGWPADARVVQLPCGDAAGGLAGAARRLAQRNPDRLDLLLLSCPLENYCGYLPPPPPASALRMAAIVYDLIPALFPGQYLQHPAIAQAYWQALETLSQYDMLLTISDSGRSDYLRLSRGSPQRVLNISAASDSTLFAARHKQETALSEIRSLKRWGVSQPFIYSLTALDHRKNLHGALAAYQLLPAALQTSHQLVLTCAMSSDGDYARVRNLVAQSRVADRVVLTGSLSDEELRLLYQSCDVFLFPSRYEGFGLPILEAMQCGAPVVAGKNSSQIEVVGQAGLLAEVDEPADIAARLQEILSSPELARRLRTAGPQQARKFSWQQTAERCHAALAEAVQGPPAASALARLLASGRRTIKRRLGWRTGWKASA